MKKNLTFILVLALVLMAFSAVVSAQDETVTFWTSENQPERVERQEAIAAAFMEANPGVTVEVVPVEENEMGQLMTVNLAAGTVPDVVLHSVQFSARWADEGAIDPEAATSIIEELGIDTFSPGALALAEVEPGLYASVPSDGWGQLLLFRQDLFEAAGLEAPTSYELILSAAQALHDPDNGFYGFCGPNSASEVYTWQVFEHIALANGATFVDGEGNITVDNEAWINAIQFYADLMTSAGQPETDWYWDQTRSNYQAGNCAMTIWSPFILDEMAGLRDSALPTCPECTDNPAFIAENTSVVSAFTGYNSDVPAAWGSTFNVGIRPDASEAARDFVLFWFNEAYLDALSVAPEGKFPMRTGTPDEPTTFLDGWAQLDVGVERRAPLADFYSAETLAIIVEGADGYRRMGFDVGESLLASAVGSQFFIQENLVAVLNGEQSAEDAAAEIQIQIEDLQAELE